MGFVDWGEPVFLHTIMLNKPLNVFHHGFDLIMGHKFIRLVGLGQSACAHDNGVDILIG